MSKTPKHIAFFLPALNSGGAEKSFVMLANWFAQRGVIVDFLVFKKDGAYVESLHSNIRLITLGGGGVFHSLKPLSEYCTTEKPDWILSGLPGPNIAAILSRVLFRTAPRVLITQHHPFSIDAKTNPNFRKAIRTFLAKCIFRYADCCVSVSQNVSDDLVHHTKIPPHKAAVIYNPLDLAAIREGAQEPVEHAWCNDPTIPLYISVGRLSAPKDFLTILKALTHLDQGRLLILGEGEDRKKILHWVQQLNLTDRADLMGFVPNPFAYISKSRALILSSLYEGLGNVLIEGMALNVPVISSDCPGGPAEILDKERYGALFPVGDDKKLAELMKEARAKPEAVTFAETFSLDRIARLYIDVLNLEEGTAPAHRQQ